MLFLSRHTAGVVRSAVLLLFASGLAYSSAVTVNSTVTSSGGLYDYAYSIAYTGMDDAFLIDISVAADPTAVTNIMTPAGFTSQFDSVNGLVSFLEDGSSFTSTPTSGFSFESPIAPSSSMFSASVVDSNANIYSIAGTTSAPTPEPASLYLLAFMTPVFLIFKRRLKTL